ncbi:Inositol monophosphatase 1 [Araneus ventricosus]|uniref:inositol-phosphate phosphatase n=1 Tax=Araneus ventricosus TaxID=182803 RepID=A0A4Y2S5F6_ARAVE|nr:Inositol monophosphatase 1 [Araneus ventricosus]
MMGSAALNMCTVAAGEADAYFAYTIHCWDMAAGKIIVEEAGGTCIDSEGGDLDIMSRRVICSSSPALAKTLSRELKHIRCPRDE